MNISKVNEFLVRIGFPKEVLTGICYTKDGIVDSSFHIGSHLIRIQHYFRSDRCISTFELKLSKIDNAVCIVDPVNISVTVTLLSRFDGDVDLDSDALDILSTVARIVKQTMR